MKYLKTKIRYIGVSVASRFIISWYYLRIHQLYLSVQKLSSQKQNKNCACMHAQVFRQCETDQTI